MSTCCKIFLEVTVLDMISLLKKLTDAPGVSGAETEVARVCAELLSEFCDKVYINNRGSVVGEIHGDGPGILLDAHIDQVGFVVTYLAENGFVKVDRCGRVDERTLAGLPVTILGTEPVYGVISSVPPHLASAADAGKAKPVTEIAIDTGLTDEDLKKFVSLGDRVVMNHKFGKLLGNEVTSGALDDRSGIAVLLRTVEILKEQGVRPNLTVTFSVQEEEGGRGAATAVFDGEHEYAIAVDVSFAYTPGCTREETADIGKGPMIGVSPIICRAVSDKLFAIAQEKDIPYQSEIMSGRTGTHADEIAVTKTGIKTGIVSIPLKYMHTPCEVIDLTDLENSAQLIAGFCEAVKNGGAN